MQDLIDRPATAIAAATATAANAPRLDLYGPIHQTLRSAMAKVLVSLGALDIGDAAECVAVLGNAQRVLGLMESHLQHEDAFVHPALLAADPATVADTEADHQQHRSAIAMLRAEIDSLAAAPPAAGDVAGLYRRFALFVAENHEHMHNEETRNNAALWACYSDAELLDIHDRLIASIPPAELAETLHLMLPALNPQQRAGMLGAMQAKAPPAAMQRMLAIAEDVLDRPGWAKLKLALGR
jgi:Hemerythrin HHE cation binding domain